MFPFGQLLDNKYRIGRLIGEGGMGVVYEAEAILLHRRVAIKVQTSSHGNSQTSGEMAMRFQLEAQAAGRIGSRHIVDVIDLGRLESGEHFMVMEYLDGQSLRDRVDARRALTVQELYPIAEQLLVGVAAAHSAGIVHRDLKPENVFLVRQPDGSDFVKILDFGISKFNDIRGSRGSFSLTRTGALMGTPRYLSPEQAAGSKSIDQRTDIYMVGVILYECLTGVVPYGANTFNELLFQIVQEAPPPITERVPSVDPGFAALIECAMQKDPKLRFQSAEEMSEALRAVLRGEGFSTRPSGPSSPPARPSLVPANDPPAARLSERTGMAPPPNESSAKSWARGDSVAGGLKVEGPTRKRSMAPWIGAAVAVALAAAALALFLPRRSSEDTTLSPPPPGEQRAAAVERPSEAIKAAAPAAAETAAVTAPSASLTPPAPARASGAPRRGVGSSSLAKPEPVSAATAAAAKTSEVTPPPAAPASSSDLARIQGAGRLIRQKL